MIGAIQGTVFQNRQNPLVLMTGGVGYAIHVPDKMLTGSRIGNAMSVYTHTHVRDDAIELYGFSTPDELRLFELLLTVSGIGPKTALAITDRGTQEVEKAVRTADVDFFTTIPRLGKKNAQKIIIELKAKLGSFQDIDLSGTAENETKQIIDALQSMGFVKAEIIPAIKHLGLEDKTIEQKIRRALQILAKQ